MMAYLLDDGYGINSSGSVDLNYMNILHGRRDHGGQQHHLVQRRGASDDRWRARPTLC